MTLCSSVFCLFLIYLYLFACYCWWWCCEIEPIMHWFLGSQYVACTMCRKCRDVVDATMKSMLMCHCGWLMLPHCHLIVCLLPPCHLIVCLLFLNFFDCIGRNEVMRLRKKGNDTMIFNASYLNDHTCWAYCWKGLIFPMMY